MSQVKFVGENHQAIWSYVTKKNQNKQRSSKYSKFAQSYNNSSKQLQWNLSGISIGPQLVDFSFIFILPFYFLWRDNSPVSFIFLQ